MPHERTFAIGGRYGIRALQIRLELAEFKKKIRLVRIFGFAIVRPKFYEPRYDRGYLAGIMKCTKLTNRRQLFSFMIIVHKQLFIATLLVMISSKLSSSQAFTHPAHPAHPPSLSRNGHKESIRLAQTTNDDGRSSEEPAQELGRFYKVRPKWEGSSYSYVRPIERSRNESGTKENINTDADESSRNRVDLDFPNCGKVVLYQDPSLVADHGVSGTGHTLWSAALAMSSYLDKELENTSDAPMLGNRKIETCLELGAGLGLPSIVATRHGVPRVIATDTDKELGVMRGLEESMRRNLSGEQYAKQVSVEALDWRHPREELIQKLGTLDLIIVSDVIWKATRPSWKDLFSLLEVLRNKSDIKAEQRDPLVLMGYTQRRLDMTLKEEQEFFDLVRQSGMQLKPIPSEASDNWPLTVIWIVSK